jgi:hypothetical protein
MEGVGGKNTCIYHVIPRRVHGPAGHAIRCYYWRRNLETEPEAGQIKAAYTSCRQVRQVRQVAGTE